MQLGDKSCSTKPLTISFGWDDARTIVQHDTQEFCRVLMDNLETKMKDTPQRGQIAAIFRGKCRRYIRGISVPFEKHLSEEDFYDLSMVVKDCATLEASWRKYTEAEVLEGDNRYDTGTDLGKIDVRMGSEFVEFPPVLQLHLRRFEYDYDFDRNVKINSRFEFPPVIDLAPYLAQRTDISQIYDLYGVLVHSGDVGYGHYYAYLRTSTDPQWFEFNDSSVTQVSPDKAIDSNFGGSGSFSAYVLVYVRRADSATILDPIHDDEVPEHIRAHMTNPDDSTRTTSGTFTVYPLSESVEYQTLSNGTGFLCEPLAKQLPFDASTTNETIYERVAEAFGRSVDAIRLWYSSTGAPTWEFKRDKTPATNPGSYKFWVDNGSQGQTGRTLYLKFFHLAWEQRIQYIGSAQVAAALPIADLISEVNRRMGVPLDTELEMYEETASKSATLKTWYATSTVTSCQLLEATVLIFQVPRGVDVPPMTFVPKPPIAAVQAAAPAGAGSDLPCIEITPSVIETVDQHFKVIVTPPVFLTLFDYYEPEKPLARLHVSAYEHFTNVIPRIKASQHIEMDEDSDTLLLYRKDYTTDGPYCLPINIASTGTAQLAYPGSPEKKYLFFRVLRGIAPALAATGALVWVRLSLDGINVSKSRTFHMAATPETFANFRQRLIDEGFLDVEPIRAYIISTTIRSFSLATDTSNITAYTNLYIELVPEDQRELGADERLLTLKRAARGANGYLEANEKPFHLKIGPQTTLDDLRPAIRNLLQLTEEQETKVKYFTGEGYVQYHPKSACAGDLVFSSLSQTAVLFAVTDTRRKPGPVREQAVKIHN
jgi:ubiquitin carboxyl-terminal hydrolase 7